MEYDNVKNIFEILIQKYYENEMNYQILNLNNDSIIFFLIINLLKLNIFIFFIFKYFYLYQITLIIKLL